MLIKQARKLYCDIDRGLDINDAVYALDATTIDLCLSLFDWAHFRRAKGAVKLHTLGLPTHTVRIRDGLRKQRNVTDCDGGLVTQALLQECLEQAESLLGLAERSLT